MFRKFITLILFTLSVSLAVFGQDALSADKLKTVLSDMGHRAYDHWPQARKEISTEIGKEIGKSIPKTAQGLAKQLNDFSPSAGIPADMCLADALWQPNNPLEKLST